MSQVFLDIFLRNSEPRPGLRVKFFCGDKFRKRWKVCRKYFLVRGYGARFFAEQNFASDEKFATSIFGSGATGQAFWRRTISQAMFCPGLRGKIFVRGYGARFLAGKNCASDEKVFSGIFFTKTRTPGPHFLFM